eukprot:00938.XXX_1303_1706_1 [CDS] Oithona nana genome sequencing.
MDDVLTLIFGYLTCYLGVAVDTAAAEEEDSNVETVEVVIVGTTEETISIGMIAMSATIATEAAIVAMTTKTDSSRASKAIKRLKDEVLHIQIHDFLEEIYSNGQKIKFHSSFS